MNTVTRVDTILTARSRGVGAHRKTKDRMVSISTTASLEARPESGLTTSFEGWRVPLAHPNPLAFRGGRGAP